MTKKEMLDATVAGLPKDAIDVDLKFFITLSTWAALAHEETSDIIDFATALRAFVWGAVFSAAALEVEAIKNYNGGRVPQKRANS